MLPKPLDLEQLVAMLQRWPHLAAAVVGVAVLAFGWRKALSAVGLLAALAATAFAIFHVGVEWQWWEGPMACTGGMDRRRVMAGWRGGVVSTDGFAAKGRVSLPDDA